MVAGKQKRGRATKESRMGRHNLAASGDGAKTAPLLSSPFGVKEIRMKPNKTITIMADFGLGPYAWLKDASDESDYVGVNIANSRTGMDEFDISDRLQK